MIRVVFNFSIRIYHEGQKKEKKRKHREPNFLDIVDNTIKTLLASRGKSTIDNYRTAIASFVRYAGSNVSVGDISKQMVEGWQLWLKEQGVKLNTISCYMRSLRSIINLSDMPSIVSNAFNTVFTGNLKTDKRSMSTSDLQKLRTIQLPKGSSLCFARDLFLFCVYALGMPFVDVAFLRKKQIVNGYIEYQRHKTRQPIRVKIEPQMQRIIKRYSLPDSAYVFPVLTTGSMKEYETARNRYNRHLRQISKIAGLRRSLTSYVARHSWASMAYSNNVDLAVISKALGHSNTETTMVYIREIDDNRIDMANRKLLGTITKTTHH